MFNACRIFVEKFSLNFIKIVNIYLKSILFCKYFEILFYFFCDIDTFRIFVEKFSLNFMKITNIYLKLILFCKYSKIYFFF